MSNFGNNSARTRNGFVGLNKVARAGTKHRFGGESVLLDTFPHSDRLTVGDVGDHFFTSVSDRQKAFERY
jgi:hypothetical protein